VNIAESLVVAIRAGMGIGMLPLYAAVDGLRDGTLVRVLPNHTLQNMNIYALYASRKFTDAKVLAWVELLRAYLPEVIARDKALLAGWPAAKDRDGHPCSLCGPHAELA
jgi:DNA-binding transcriptional LysR family regulator